MSLRYVYAVLDAPLPEEGAQPLLGVAGEPVRTVAVHGLHVAVGELDAAPQPALEPLRRHDAVVRSLATRARALLPMRFGQTAAGEEELARSVERALPRLQRSLARVAGCEQVDLRLFGERPGAEAAPPAAMPPPLPPGPPGAGPGARYLAERLRRRALERTPPPELAPLLARLAPLVRAERVQRSPTGRLLATVYQLVRATDRAAYLARLEAGRRAQPELRVAVSGPWPPYAFADGLGPEESGDDA